MTNIILTQYAEIELCTKTKADIADLLTHSFPGVFQTGRVFFKQIPQFRILAYYEQKLVGHLGVDHRVVLADGEPIEILGVTDLCVHASYRNRGLGTKLLKQLDEFSHDKHIQVIIAFADNPILYANYGFETCKTKCRFLAVDVDGPNLMSHSVIEREESSLMILGNTKYAHIDFLGHIF